MKRIICGLMLCFSVFGQSSFTMRVQNSGSTVKTAASYLVLNFSTNLTATASGSTVSVAVSGLGSAAALNTGTSGATIPLLNTANTWSAAQTMATWTATGASGTTLSVSAPTGATANYSAVFTGGNVGIGTTSPQGLLQVYSQGQSNINNIIPLMTSNTAPSGVASCSSIYNSSNDCYMAFNGIVNHGWLAAGTQTGTLGYQFTTGQVVTQYSIIPWSFNDQPAAQRSPKTWTFQGSNDGSSWTTLDTQTNYTSWTTYTASYFIISNSTSYIYYRLNVTANGGDTYLGVQNLAMYGGNNIGVRLRGRLVIPLQ